jgi:organic hydroperoxide reductase OsmC/OhrA
MKNHDYRARLTWDGNHGDGTADYGTYGRQFRVAIDGKPDIVGSADPMFRGDAALPNPEDMLMVAVASCHMLSYLALCARARINVVSYEDAAVGQMVFHKDGSGEFTEIVLHPVVKIAAGDLEKARHFHERAHELCFIARSCNFPIRHEAEVRQD